MSYATFFSTPAGKPPGYVPDGAVKVDGKPPAKAVQPLTPQPQMSNKPLPALFTSSGTDPMKVEASLEPSLSNGLVADASTTSSLSTCEPSHLAGTIVWPLAYADTGQKALTELTGVVNNPSATLEQIVSACRHLKALGTRLKDRQSQLPTSANWKPILATAMINFIEYLAKRAGDPNEKIWNAMTLSDAAILCYAQDTCIDMQKHSALELLGATAWKTLVPSSRKVALLIAQQVVEKNLFESSDGSTGNRIAILHYFSSGLTFNPPSAPKVPMLSGSHAKYPKRSVEVAVSRAIAYLITPGVQIEGRQIGKLMLVIARVVHIPNIAIDAAAMANALCVWGNNPALVKYEDSVNPGASEYTNPIAVDNVAEAAVMFLNCGVISREDHLNFVNRVAILITKAVRQSLPKASDRNRASYTNFVKSFCGSGEKFPTSGLAEAWEVLGLPRRKN